MTKTKNNGQVVALCGGVGGAKLVLGLYRICDPRQLIVLVNTGDDFNHLGLHVSPDIDTVTYTLAGLQNPETGWGRKNETWSFMSALESLGGETWFKLGDGDLATHVERTRRLGMGETLTDITDAFRRRFGIGARLVPMSDDPVRTIVDTSDGPLTFQTYFVRERCRPVVTGIRFSGADEAHPSPAVVAALTKPELRAVVICPSNPYLSIDPILSLPGMRESLEAAAAPVVSVSPIVEGAALKGPTAKIMRELGIPITAAGVARHYGSLLGGFIVDQCDANLRDDLDVPSKTANTVMTSLSDRMSLAQAVLDFADELKARSHPRRSGQNVGRGSIQTVG